jgi:holliday junction DNA helicase RuvA
MIAFIEGKLVKLDVDENLALIQVGSIGYEIMLPVYCVSLLSSKIGSQVTLCTMEYYEGTLGGGNLIPRIVGFINNGDKDFFNKVTSVKGMGIKKTLRCMAMPIASIAAAIEQDDEKLLSTLPGIGKKTAQMIIAELKGKLQGFTEGAVSRPSAMGTYKPFQAEALEILIAWGEKRNEAMELIELACKKHPDVITAEMLVPLCYRIKQGTEV